ncbi:MAG: hypothetical protein QME81_13255 [bacterium]|nr:hypothetical protein [bacterium]
MLKTIEGIYHDGKIELADMLAVCRRENLSVRNFVVVELARRFGRASSATTTRCREHWDSLFHSDRLLGEVHDKTPVIVTFLEPIFVDLRARGIDKAHAAELRARLATFAEEWDSLEMEIYDD